MDAEQRPFAVVFVRDLMFSTRIVEAARAAGVAFKVIRDPAALPDQPGDRLFVDLNQPGALDAATAWRAKQGGTVIGFVSHVDTETISRARASGMDHILARGQLVSSLPRLLMPLAQG